MSATRLVPGVAPDAAPAPAPPPRWRGRLAGAARALAAFALPQRCAACETGVAPEHALCDACARRVPPVLVPLCARCLALEREPHGCRRHRAFAVWAAWVYDERAEAAVHAFKFAGRERLAASLGERIAHALPAGYRPDVVIEIPLHPSRRRERGFDQSQRLADAVARVLQTPRIGALVRRRATRQQSKLGARARRQQMRGAFALVDPAAWRGRQVLLVDDVLTSGATLEAAITTLNEAGAATTAAVLAWAS